MRLLLDTHIAIWAALDPASLSDAERKHLTDPTASLTLSAVSIWELRLKWQSFHISGTRKSPIGPQSILAFATAVGWNILPLTATHASASLIHPMPHKDPFDELLLVQAQEENLRLLTRDTKLLNHPLSANRPP